MKASPFGTLMTSVPAAPAPTPSMRTLAPSAMVTSPFSATSVTVPAGAATVTSSKLRSMPETSMIEPDSSCSADVAPTSAARAVRVTLPPGNAMRPP